MGLAYSPKPASSNLYSGISVNPIPRAGSNARAAALQLDILSLRPDHRCFNPEVKRLEIRHPLSPEFLLRMGQVYTRPARSRRFCSSGSIGEGEQAGTDGGHTDILGEQKRMVAEVLFGAKFRGHQQSGNAAGRGAR